MQRYFIKNNQIDHSHILLNKQDSHHVKNVMRMRVGDFVECCDETLLYLGRIVQLDPQTKIEITNQYPATGELAVQVSIAHGVVRREKTEEVMRRLVELGCYAYLPIMMKRSQVKPISDKLERWQTIIKEASEQAKRSKLMMITEPQSWKSLLTTIKDYDLCLVADAGSHPLMKDGFTLNNIANIIVVIGPEGGFDSQEIIDLQRAGGRVVSFGNHIFRTETAPLYAMSVLRYTIGEANAR